MAEPTTPGAASGSEQRPDPRLWAGVGSVVIFLIGLGAGLGMLTGSWPLPHTSPERLLVFVIVNRSAVALIACTQALTAVPLAVFAAGLARTFGGRAAPQLIAAGVLAAGTLIGSAALTSALTLPALTGQPALTAVLAYLVFLIGGPAHVASLALLTATTAAAGRRSGRLPGRLCTFGFVVAAIGLLSLLNLALPALPPLATAVFIPAGRFGGFAFIVGSVITLWRGRPEPRR